MGEGSGMKEISQCFSSKSSNGLFLVGAGGLLDTHTN